MSSAARGGGGWCTSTGCGRGSPCWVCGRLVGLNLLKGERGDLGDLFELVGDMTLRLFSGANSECGLGLSLAPGAVDSEELRVAAPVEDEGGPLLLLTSFPPDEESSAAKASG